jgi:hypothetical protein
VPWCHRCRRSPFTTMTAHMHSSCAPVPCSVRAYPVHPSLFPLPLHSDHYSSCSAAATPRLPPLNPPLPPGPSSKAAGHSCSQKLKP